MSDNKCNHDENKKFTFIKDFHFAPGDEVYMCECGALYSFDVDSGDIHVVSGDELISMIEATKAAAVKADKEYQPVDLRSDDFR